MYSRIIATLVLFVAMSLSSLADAKKADEIIQKSLNATGGKERLEKLTTFSLTADMNIPSQGMDIKINFWLKKPDKMRIVQEIPAMQMKIEAGTDGTTYWAVQPGSDTRTAVPDMAVGQVKGQLDGLKNILDSPLLNYKDNNFQISYVGLEDIDEKKCNVVNVIDNEGTNSNFYFDAITNLIYCSKSTVSQGGEDFEVELKYREYQKVDGLFIPKRIEISQNKELQTKISLSDVKFNEAINDNDFKAN